MSGPPRTALPCRARSRAEQTQGMPLHYTVTACSRRDGGRYAAARNEHRATVRRRLHTNRCRGRTRSAVERGSSIRRPRAGPAEWLGRRAKPFACETISTGGPFMLGARSIAGASAEHPTGKHGRKALTTFESVGEKTLSPPLNRQTHRRSLQLLRNRSCHCGIQSSPKWRRARRNGCALLLTRLRLRPTGHGRGVQAVGRLTKGLRSRATGGIEGIAPGMMTVKRSDGR